MKVKRFKLAFYKKNFPLFILLCFLLFFSAVVLAQTNPYSGTSGSSFQCSESIPIGKDPIVASNGAYTFEMPLFSLGGPIDFHADLTYRSNQVGWFPLPRGFASNLFYYADAVLSNGTLYATFFRGTGDQIAFKKTPSGDWILTGPTENLWGETWVDQKPGKKYVLKDTTNYAYFMDPFEKRIYIFYKHLNFGGENGHLASYGLSIGMGISSSILMLRGPMIFPVESRMDWVGS